MNNHAAKEDGVEPGERRIEPCNQTPRDSEEEIASVMNLTSFAIPAVAEDLVSVLRSDGFRVSDPAILEIRERRPLLHDATLLLSELILLAVGRVPDIVDAKVGDDPKDNDPDGPVVLRWIMERDVQRTMAVGERHASHVPEDEHEAKLLVVHVPGYGYFRLQRWKFKTYQVVMMRCSPFAQAPA